MQRYRPDIWWPTVNEQGFPQPEPRMAEDSATGQYYHKDDVDRVVKALEDQRDDLYAQVHRLESLLKQTPLENYIGSLGSQGQPSCDAPSK